MGVIIRQSIKSTIVNYIGTFIGFLTTFFISTKFLTAEEIGLTRIILEAALLLSVIALLGMPSSGVKFFPYFKSDDKKHNGFFFYLVAIGFLGTIIVFVIALLLRNNIISFFSKEAALFVDYFYLIFPLAFFLTYLYIFEIYSSVLMRIVVPRFVREIIIRILTVAIFLLYAFKFITLPWMIYLYVIAYGIAALIDLIYIARIGSISLEHDVSYVRKPLRKYIFRFTGYMVLATIGAGIVARIDIFMISAISGLSYTGIYSIAFFMANIIEIPSRSIGSISMPLLSSHIKEKKMVLARNLLKKASLNQFLIGSFIFILLWINIDNVFAVLPSGDIYAQGKWVVFFLGLTRLADLIGNFSFSVLSISKYYYFTLFFIFFLSGITILSNKLLIPVLGITGASIATFFSIFLYYAIIIFLVQWKLKINPFSKGQVKVLVLTGSILLLNSFIPAFGNPYIDAVGRSFLWEGLFIFIMYFWNISSDVNSLVRTSIAKGLSLFDKYFRH
ncbi:MAG: oligosaccharide flippase family protein [Bacteroidales bacterium]|jgi:O-antigen/teichoic acid export membrane protein|nr:oligosaccharide flippase family protein [Bacteroidales bacterium]